MSSSACWIGSPGGRRRWKNTKSKRINVTETKLKRVDELKREEILKDNPKEVNSVEHSINDLD